MNKLILILGVLLFNTALLLAQVDYTIKLEPDGQTFAVYMRSVEAYTMPLAQVPTAQVTVLVPHGTGASSFVVADLTSYQSNMSWSQNARVDAPTENPTIDYISFGFQGASSFDIAANTEIKLFSFRNSSTCIGEMTLIVNATDPFNVLPNSTNTNPGNAITVFGYGGDAYNANYGAPVNACPPAGDTDGDGNPDTTDPSPNDPCVGYVAGSEVTSGSMWASADCDGDGVNNGNEATTTVGPATNPYSACSLNLSEVTLPATNTGDCDGDGVSTANEINSTNATTDPRTDPNDLCDYNEAEQGTPSATWNSADCDGDGNPNGTDPNPLVATAVDDSGVAPLNTGTNINILANDDFLPNDGNVITQVGGTAGGNVAFNATTGMLNYTPLASEAGTTKTVVYQVCQGAVCDQATVTITIPAAGDTDGDGNPDTTDPSPNDPCVGYVAGSEVTSGSMWASADCDGDGVSNGNEASTTVGPATNPYSACSLNLSEVTLPATSTGDCDGDGVSNANEINSTNATTDPRTDPNDLCDYNVAEQGTPSATWNSADCDGDGVPNGTDNCPLVPGLASNSGCPTSCNAGTVAPTVH